MKKIFVLAVALSSLTSVAIAQEPVKSNDAQPQKLTEAQMDTVAGGAPGSLISLRDVVDVNNNNIAVPINAAVAANILGGGAAAGAAQRPGNQRQ
jgi:hypothetical protein